MSAQVGASTPLYVTEADVDRHLPVDAAIAAVRRGFELLGAGLAANPVRARDQVGPAHVNTMWAAAPALGALGVKLYPIVRTDVTRGSSFTFVLHTLPEGTVRAVLEAELLGQRRTAAASAVAAAALARPGARRLGILGAGGQARHQVEALLTVLPIEEIHVASRTDESRDRLVADLRRAGRPAVAADAETAVRRSDVVVTITGASEPVLRGGWLQPGTLVVAAGSNVATKRELDRDAVLRCDRIVVDDLAGARAECGDLLANGVPVDGATPLADVLADRTGSRAPEDVVLFESQGLAIEDLMCALHVVDQLEGMEQG